MKNIILMVLVVVGLVGGGVMAMQALLPSKPRPCCALKKPNNQKTTPTGIEPTAKPTNVIKSNEKKL
jgi:hypothetical protein